MQLNLVTGDVMFEHAPCTFRRWIRHTASVPKGFLRYYVLRLLKEKPMSGSEIMEEIAKETDRRWKPSPGSIYPLLSWLKDNDYTKELPKEEEGIKRYMLTKQGEKFFEEQTKLGERLRKKLELLAPLPFGGFWFSPRSEKLREIREPVKRFVRALLDLRKALEKNPTDQALKEIGEFLNNTTKKMEEIGEKLKEGN